MIAFRVVRRRYATPQTVLSGEGARISGGRWNRMGVAAIYAAENASLALLETLVRVDAVNAPGDLVLVEIDVPAGVAPTTISEQSLPSDWRLPDNQACVTLGTQWLEAASGLVLRVPSAANPFENNLIINPRHPDIARCVVRTPAVIRVDPRLQPFFERTP